MSSADKSRQSSGGRSLFSRSKHRDKRTADSEPRHPTPDHLDAASIMSSRSSRHKRDSSIASVDSPSSPDAGINSMAGVISSIPYDAVHSNSRSPISVEYLPQGDQIPVRREPLPHQLNRPGHDYHQYPSIDQLSNPAGSHASMARTSNVTMASTGKQAQYQHWGPTRGSMASTVNGSHNSRYDSYAPTNGRGSADNFSLYSGNPEPFPLV